MLKRLENAPTGVSAFPGQTVAREGDSGVAPCIIIIEGVVDVVIGDRTVATLRRGDFLVEMPFVEGKPRSASLIARTRARLFELDPQGSAALLPLFPAMSRHMLHDLADGVRWNDHEREADTLLSLAVE
ncbi:MAG TPA: cyclic nucleotide-binding domain-containing protein [Actinomycetota bacterium]|nr:cyclic nucleotide-binding domain-containing protein [Actinomycetota bacterium]